MRTLLYLSDDWIKAAGEALDQLRIEPAPGWAVCYVVNGGPEGTTTHQLLFDQGRVSMRVGADDVSLTLTLDWDLAVAINRGEVSAQGAFLDGRIQVAGDPGVLLGHQHELTAADDAMAELRTRTVYGPASTA